VKILGIPVRVEASFLILAFLLASSRYGRVSLLIEWLLVVFVSILLHEFGHALVVRRFGLSPTIKIYAMGGVTSWSDSVGLSPPKHLLVSLAGPAAGFLFGGLLLVSGLVIDFDQSELVGQTYYDLLWVNIGWGLFNLLPVLPMDGGQILITLETWITGKKDEIFAHLLSLLFAFAIGALAMMKGQFWIGFLGFWFAYSNGSFLYHKLQARHDEKLRLTLAQAKEAVGRDEFDRSFELVETVRKKARTSWLKRDASQLAIFILILQHKHDEALIELHKFDVLYGGDPYLTALYHFDKGPAAEALPRLRAAFVESPSREVGLLLYQTLMSEKKFVEVLELVSDESLAEERWKLYANVQIEAFNSDDFETSARAGLLAYELQPHADLMYNLACAFARAGNTDEGLGWLKKAVDAGFSNKEVLASDPDLASLRSHPQFGEISNQ
jgi:Zn-dependent protease